MISVSNLSVQFGKRVLFDSAIFHLIKEIVTVLLVQMELVSLHLKY